MEVFNTVVVVLRSQESTRHDCGIKCGPSNQFSWLIAFSRFLPKSRMVGAWQKGNKTIKAEA